jgi:glucose/arabinose dehydrogenase
MLAVVRRLALLLVLVALPSSASAAPVAATVTVRMLDYRDVLSRTSVPLGNVRFVVVNRGAAPHDFAIGGKRTRMLKRGERQTLVVRFKRAGNYTYVCTVPGHSHLGMKGILRVGKPKPKPQPAPAPAPAPAPSPLKLVKIGDFELPTDVDAPPGDPSRLVVVEQRGLVHLLVDGQRREKPFLDLRPWVRAEGESGLLSLAFAPDYATSGLVYAFYNDRGGNLRLVELRRSAEDPESVAAEPARELFHQVKFAPNHNGGMLQFAGDGRLYVGVGDGGTGSGFKPGAFAQDSTSVFGKIIRVHPASGAWDVRASGLRNPWKFWHDALSGRTFVGDVGQDRREEIDVIPDGTPTINFGWPCFEGTLPFDPEASCDSPVAPVHEYPHAGDACSITGGVVIRDPRLPDLTGAFVFGDVCSTSLRALTVEGAAAVTSPLGVEVTAPTTFGVDAAGRVYVGSGSGAVYRLDPR